ncbi:hypothetical protein BY458DRAFT_561022 [Sporodiniella umbellata]|nr:hypothetical protein BY458DRAFT_561022 [Sporodiniella umbellata]
MYIRTSKYSQCKSCYRSWIYKKTQTYDFDDIFGSVDDLFQKNTKKQSVEKKKPTPVLLKSTEKPTRASSSAEKRKKEPSPALEREVYDEGLFSDMDDDKDTTIQKHLDSETKSSALSKENSPRQRNNKESAKDDEYCGLKNSTIQQQSNDDSIVVKQEKPMMKKPTLQRKTSQKNAFSIIAQGESKKSKEKIEQQAVEEELPGKQKDNPEPPEEKYELRKKRAVKEGAYFLGDDHTTCEDEDDEYIEETGEEDMYEAMDEDFSDEGVMGNTQVNEQPVNVPDKTERIAIKKSTKSAKKKNQSISEEENEEYEVYDLMDATRKTLKGSRLRKQPNSKKTRKPGNKFNPYLLFNKEMRPKIQELHPDASIGELSKIIGKRWKDLDPVGD